MKREDLTATSFITSRVVAVLIAVVGLFFLVQPDWLGWGALARALGGGDRLLSAGIGCLFLLFAALSFEKHQLRVRTAEVMEGLHQLLYGKDYKRDREAIDILLAALESGDRERSESAHAHLVRLTGQNFARDPRVWRTWWDAVRDRYAAAPANDIAPTESTE